MAAGDLSRASATPEAAEASEASGLHALDRATRLQPVAGQAHRFAGTVGRDYWNMVGPFGGVTAATALAAVLGHPERLGLPVALTVNFAAPLAAGACTVEAVPVRTNRSTQHWTLAITQADDSGQPQTVLTGTALTALRRDTWGDAESRCPPVPRPETLPPAQSRAGLGWFSHYELRPISGDVPAQWDGALRESLTRLWVRDQPPRPLDFVSLAAQADIFFGRILLRRAAPTPFGTVSLTVYFHADEAALARAGSGYLLAQARGQAYFKGYHDQAAQLWSEAGELLATTHQVVYYKG
ncbi:MAG: thioesterase family protein [Comamonas sp.]